VNHSGNVYHTDYDLNALELPQRASILALAERPQDAEFVYSRWQRVHVRQTLWQYAKEAVDWTKSSYAAPLDRLFQHLHTYKNVAHVRKNAMIDTAEINVLGKKTTHSDNPHERLAFWRLAQIYAHGITPADLDSEYDVEERIRQDILTEVALNRKYAPLLKDLPAGPRREALLDQLHEERATIHRSESAYPAMIHPTNAEAIRGWAYMYLSSGRMGDDVCKALTGRQWSSPYLTEPVRRSWDQKPSWQEGYRRLEWWATFGITSLTDLKKLPFAVNKALPVSTHRDQPATKEDQNSRRTRIAAKSQETHEYFGAWPLAYRPAIALAAEQLNLARFDRPAIVLAAEGLDLAQFEAEGANASEIDAVEQRLFGQLVTNGDDKARCHFWLRLFKVYRSWHHEHRMQHPLNPSAEMYEEEIYMGAKGFLLMGFEPEYYSAALEYGRGGLTMPISKQTLQERGLAKDPRYKPLHRWVHSTRWSEPGAVSQYEAFSF